MNINIELTGPCLVPADHVPTDAERRHVLLLFFTLLCRWRPREADFRMAELLADTPNSIQELKDGLRPFAEYIWDHLLGKPPNVTVDSATEAGAIIIDKLYTLPEPDRTTVGLRDLRQPKAET